MNATSSDDRRIAKGSSTETLYEDSQSQNEDIGLEKQEKVSQVSTTNPFQYEIKKPDSIEAVSNPRVIVTNQTSLPPKPTGKDTNPNMFTPNVLGIDIVATHSTLPQRTPHDLLDRIGQKARDNIPVSIISAVKRATPALASINRDGGNGTSIDWIKGNGKCIDKDGCNGKSIDENCGNDTPFQYTVIKNIVEDVMNEYHSLLSSDVHDMHLELIRQFQLQKIEIRTVIEQYAPKEVMMRELESLRSENERLRML